MVAPNRPSRKDAVADTETVTQTELAQRLPDLVNRAGYAGQRTVITRHGEPFAAIVPFADLGVLEKHAPAA